MNTTILIGRLTKDPELSYTQGNQTAVCKFTLAVDRPKRQGEDTGADFIRIIVFGKIAENCDRYLFKGKQAAVKGRIQTGSYKNRDGQTVYTTDVVAETVEFLGGTERRQQAPADEYPSRDIYDDMPGGFEAADEDIPF